MVPSAATSIGGSIRSGSKYRRLAATSPGSGKFGERGQVDVVCAADARLEHPAVPHRHAARRAQVVDPDRLRVSAEPARLDVDDAARARVDRVRGASRAL